MTAIEHVRVTYDDRIVRKFVLASIFWGIVGMTVGLWAAIQLFWPESNLGQPWLGFGRIRPLHTNAVIFAFVGNMIFAGVYYSTQRLCKARMANDMLSSVHFWGWQLIIVAAAITLPMGMTQGKEYAELEWHIDIGVTLIWVVFAVNFFWTLAKRREKHLYVALWFYIATIVTVAVLYIVNNLALPVLADKSYVIYAGVQDALVQWWYGHNAVAFFLTTPVLGIMYYYLPKAANRPVYSYRLSIIHFWALIFLYIWAGPHHLLYTSMPDWAQSLAMVFSLMLWAPSWGGMLNGLLTLRGAWHLLRTDPVIKFFIAGVTFYGMATFEGPLLSIKAVSALGHYTDWIIGHVHTGALGWNGFMAAGMIYWLVPRLYGTKLYSTKAADAHFWIGMFGILLYAISMWVAGITEGLMWRATTEDGGLVYEFVESNATVIPMYITRAVGGTLFLAGFFILAWNIYKTIRSGKAVDVTVEVAERPKTPKIPWKEIVFNPLLVLGYLGVFTMCMFFFADLVFAIIFLAVSLIILMFAGLLVGKKVHGTNIHRLLEGRPLIFTVLVTLAILVGGVAELVPTLMIDKAVPTVGLQQTPYSPLEVHGRDIYVREGCYTCHSQQIRPFVSESLRYGPPSTAGESRYDHPFQWGSKRTGPDLARVGSHGGKSNHWHFLHLMDPRETSDGRSLMPSYAFMANTKIDIGDTVVKLSALKTLGVPYTKQQIANGEALVREQAQTFVDDLATNGIVVDWDAEIIALTAYLQSLGNNLVDPNAEPAGDDVSGAPAPGAAPDGPPSAPRQ